MASAIKRKILLSASIVAAVIAIIILAFYCWTQIPVFSKGKPVLFEIAPGTTAARIVTELEKQNVPVNNMLFGILVRISGNSTNLLAGDYELRAGETPAMLLHKITKGIFAMESLTVIEGWRFQQMRLAMAKHPWLKHETANMSENELMKRLGIHHHSGEGLFFPDTYLFKKGTPDMEVYRQAYKAMMTRLNTLWENRNTELPYKKPYDALIMASIVEKETGHPGDRTRIAGVFVKRLKIGMKLQTDPTVIYGMGDRYRGKIRRIDLRTDTPYNTYTRYGLPPTPIALPGKDALDAAFHPAETNALYFVSRGDGTSHFSHNLDEHNKAVEKYILR